MSLGLVCYTAGNPPQCHRAKIIEDHGGNPHELYLRVDWNDSLGGFHVVAREDTDPNHTTTGTWHPRHEEPMTDTSERLSAAYKDLHGRLSSYYEEVAGYSTEDAELHAINLIGNYAEALTDHMNEARP